MNQKQKINLRKLWEGKKYKPLDLRPKLTRAKRYCINLLVKKVFRNFGLREESEVAGFFVFSLIRMIVYFR